MTAPQPCSSWSVVILPRRARVVVAVPMMATRPPPRGRAMGTKPPLTGQGTHSRHPTTSSRRRFSNSLRRHISSRLTSSLLLPTSIRRLLTSSRYLLTSSRPLLPSPWARPRAHRRKPATARPWTHALIVGEQPTMSAGATGYTRS